MHPFSFSPFLLGLTSDSWILRRKGLRDSLIANLSLAQKSWKFLDIGSDSLLRRCFLSGKVSGVVLISDIDIGNALPFIIRNAESGNHALASTYVLSISSCQH